MDKKSKSKNKGAAEIVENQKNQKDQTSKETQKTQEDQNIQNTQENQTSQENQKDEKTQIDFEEKYLRLLAEYANFAKQKEIELQNVAKFANKNILIKVLDILDDIDSGLNQEMVSEETRNILNILKIKIQQILAYEGVFEIELKSGDKYDPEKCEVVDTVENNEMSGKIVKVLRKGYLISDRVLRTAKVIVGK